MLRRQLAYTSCSVVVFSAAAAAAAAAGMNEKVIIIVVIGVVMLVCTAGIVRSKIDWCQQALVTIA